MGLHFTDALGHAYSVLLSPYGTKMVDGSDITVPRFTQLKYADVYDEEGNLAQSDGELNGSAVRPPHDPRDLAE
jgi:hypothetical protein